MKSKDLKIGRTWVPFNEAEKQVESDLRLLIVHSGDSLEGTTSVRMFSLIWKHVVLSGGFFFLFYIDCQHKNFVCNHVCVPYKTSHCEEQSVMFGFFIRAGKKDQNTGLRAFSFLKERKKKVQLSTEGHLNSFTELTVITRHFPPGPLISDD